MSSAEFGASDIGTMVICGNGALREPNFDTQLFGVDMYEVNAVYWREMAGKAAFHVYPLDVAWGRVLGPGALAAALAAFAVLAPLPDVLTPVGWKLLALGLWLPAAWRLGVPPEGREQVRAGLAALLRR